MGWKGQGLKNQTSGTFAGKPSAPYAGQEYFATDIGTGIWITYTGSKWKPSTGIATLVSDGTLHSGAGTGAEANYHVVTIPAGLLSANGQLRITATMNCTGTNGGKTLSLRFSATSGDVATGMQLISSAFGGSNTTLSAGFIKNLYNNNSVSSQIASNTGQGSYASASSTGEITGAINTAVVSYLNFNINGNASDTLGYQGITVEWIEP